MALSLQNLFCSGSEDFDDDEDFLSVVEDAESSLSVPEPKAVYLRPISKTLIKDSEEQRSFDNDRKPSQTQHASFVQEDASISVKPIAPSLVQDVDDEELLSVASELEAEGQYQASGNRLLSMSNNQTTQRNNVGSNSSSFRLRPPQMSPFQDQENQQWVKSIPSNPQYYQQSSGVYEHSQSEPIAKRFCLNPSAEKQPVTPVRVETRPLPSLSTYPHCNMPASPSTNTWQNSVGNIHSLPRTPLSTPRPHPPSTLQTPVVTNHLVQLMTAANKTPKKLTWETPPSKERKFPGPAGLLPQQSCVRGLDEILVSTLHKPNHGAQAKLHSKEAVSTQQPVAEDFIRGPWATMKAELSLDENDPTCFLRTYSVVMVLRKAALKQLPRNKVPQMAVALKSLTPANGDASAVFRDPTGEIQGTFHHLLLEERESELKAGSVLLLQQVGVFSPSHRNHYLNVTPSNVVKIYPPVAEGGSSRVSASLKSQMEIDVNGNQTLSAHHLSSNIIDSSVSQPTEFFPSPSTAHPSLPQPAASLASSHKAHPRLHQSAASFPSSNTAHPRLPQPAGSFLSSSTAQPSLHQPAESLLLSNAANPRLPQPAASFPSSSTAHPRLLQPAASFPSLSTAHLRLHQPASSFPSSSTAHPRLHQPRESFPSSSTMQLQTIVSTSEGDWDMDDLDTLLLDLPEDPGS